MKKTALLMVIVVSLFTLPVLAQTAAEAPKDRGEATINLGGGKVTVEHGRPAVSGRDITKMIEPGAEWRMGSNAPTSLTSDIDLKFGDKIVAKGKYTLKAKLIEAGKWHLMIYKEKDLVAEVPMTLGKNAQSVELVTIKLDKDGAGAKLILEWGTLNLSAKFQKS